MGKPYSEDLRRSVVQGIESGISRRQGRGRGLAAALSAQPIWGSRQRVRSGTSKATRPTPICIRPRSLGPTH
jgi:hypothetical protein